MGHPKGLKFTPEQLEKRRITLQRNFDMGINQRNQQTSPIGHTNIEYLEAKLAHRQPSQRPFTETHLEHMWVNPVLQSNYPDPIDYEI